jgi:ABC-type antimicrobial peptide transport system permease subunit
LIIVSAGLAVGIPAAWLVSRLADRQLNGLLFKLAPTDPLNVLLATVVLVLVAMSAGLIPARRAARIDPVVALRIE